MQCCLTLPHLPCIFSQWFHQPCTPRSSVQHCQRRFALHRLCVRTGEAETSRRGGSMAVRGLSCETDEVERTDDRPAGGPQPVLKVRRANIGRYRSTTQLEGASPEPRLTPILTMCSRCMGAWATWCRRRRRRCRRTTRPGGTRCGPARWTSGGASSAIAPSTCSTSRRAPGLHTS